MHAVYHCLERRCGVVLVLSHRATHTWRRLALSHDMDIHLSHCRFAFCVIDCSTSISNSKKVPVTCVIVDAIPRSADEIIKVTRDF